MARHLFFLGKGGVGKSTLSAIEGLKEAGEAKECLIVSLDPAHNQSDIFEGSFGEKPKTVTKHLQVIEIDLESSIKKYLKGIESKIKESYRYLAAFNLENQFDIIRYSPGIEEYALLQAYNRISDKYVNMDTIIFDMPPTALTLKFFSLPKLSLLWLGKLQNLRNQIIEKREIITKIKFGSKTIETDKISKNLHDQASLYQNINKNFQDSSITHLILVMNPDTLSLNESLKIRERIQSLNFIISCVMVNKYQGQEKNIFNQFNESTIQYFALNQTPLTGLQNLKNYLKSLS